MKVISLSHLSLCTFIARLLINITPVLSYAISGSRRIQTKLFTATEPLAETSTKINNTVSNKPASKHSLHLISLPPKDDSFSQPAESLVRECWKWKDAVLGDGRDYFVPRPKTLKAFHSLFVGMEVCVDVDLVTDSDQGGEVIKYSLNQVEIKMPQRNSDNEPILECLLAQDQFSTFEQSKSTRCVTKSYMVEECVALSNCARFEVILVLKDLTEGHSKDGVPAVNVNMPKVAESVARLSVAYHICRQTQSYQSKSSSFLQRSGLTSWMDTPDSIHVPKGNDATDSISSNQSKSIMQLANRFISMEGTYSISTHLSLIASGLAPRTNRPDREVIFRPYSSRDAHILLQLKRTAEVISSVDFDDKQGGRGRIKILLDGALSAGKAARNEKIVPDIRRLKEFGSDGTPPSGLANVVAEAAIRLAVNPTVKACVARLKATEAANQISLLRQRVNNIVDLIAEKNANIDKLELQKVANGLLHAPTVTLREGEVSELNVEDVVQNIEIQLKLQSGLIDDR